MIAKTFVTTFIAASFMAGSHASPCKRHQLSSVSLRPFFHTDVSERSVTSDYTTTATGGVTTDLGSIIVESSTETSTIADDATTTAVPTTDLSSTIEESSTKTETALMDTNTAESTTTTAEAPPAPTFMANADFDDEPDTTEPWVLYQRRYVLPLQHDQIRGQKLGTTCIHRCPNDLHPPATGKDS